MRHPDLEMQVDAWLDGELPAVEAGEIEAHLERCPQCARFREERLALRHAVRTALPQLTPSATLEARVRRQLKDARVRERARAGLGPRQWMAIAASLLIVALGSWQLGRQQPHATDLGDEVLRSHVRALMPGHLTDVLSSDQHTVKPWFNGVLDYSPPVYDFAGRGYPLIGGRLEYIGGKKVAALVYGRRKHLITVLVWPRAQGESAGKAGFRQGYNLLSWTTPSYVYWITSDLGRPELTEFSTLLREADAMAGAGPKE